MSDEPREPETGEPREPEAPEPPEPPEAAAAGDRPPKPATWAGRRRAAGEGAGDGDSSEEEGGAGGGGLTDEFDGLEAELSAELGGAGDAPEEPAPEETEETEEPEVEEPPRGGVSQETVEVDTLAVADREAAQEAAHAGLRARAAEEASRRGATTGSHLPPAAVPPATAAGAAAVAGGAGAVAGAAGAALANGAGEPPKRTLPWRFFAGSVVVITSVAAATAVAFLLYLTDVGADLRDPGFDNRVGDELSEIDGDEPQTILILGSDKRTSEDGDPGRSDTTMLLRVDPDKEFLALLSLPRDLRVEIPGYGTDKLNAAYSYGEQYEQEDGGGPKLTLKTVKELLGIDVNHIVNIDFEGFYEAVNAIGCVYVDIDRHYYNPPESDYDDIDIEAGYTKLCGYRALDYVRYRHNDNDVVRGARQQDFLREARQQIPPRDLLPPPFGNSDLIDIFTKHTSSDIDDAPTIVEMLKSFVDVRSAPVRQVDLESTFETISGVAYVTTTQEQIDTAVEQFLGQDLDDAPAEPAPAEPKQDKKDKPKPPVEPPEPEMIDSSAAGIQYAQSFAKYLDDKKAKLPVFYPTKIVANSGATITDESRAFPLASPDDRTIYRGYKFVVTYQEEGFTSYYGLSGVNWTDPPILNNPSETRQIDGRDYMLFFDGDRLRLVGWKTSKGSYWVINTLTQTLSEDEMLALATSASELDE